MSNIRGLEPINGWQDHYKEIEFIRNRRPVPEPDKTYPPSPEENNYAGLWPTDRHFIPEGEDEFLDDYRTEYEYAYNNDIDFLNFQEWLVLEHFFGTRLAYEEYDNLASYYNEHEEVDGNILEIENIYDPIRIGDIAYFTCGDSDSDIENEPVKVIRLLTPAEVDIFDVGPMFKVRLKDGTVEDAFFDELTFCEQKKEATTREEMKRLREGDIFVVCGESHIAQSDAHESGDASVDCYIVYDEEGESWFDDDFPE